MEAQRVVDRQVRYRCELHALFQPAGGQAEAIVVLEISETGAFIAAAPGLEDLQVGDRGTLTLAMPAGDFLPAAVEVAQFGHSRRDVAAAGADNVTVSVGGVGVEFVELPDDDLERLRDYLELLDGR